MFIEKFLISKAGKSSVRLSSSPSVTAEAWYNKEPDSDLAGLTKERGSTKFL